MTRQFSNLRLEALKGAAGAAAAGAAIALLPGEANAAPVTLPLTVHAGGADWLMSNNTSGATTGNGLGLMDAYLVGPPARTDGYDGAFVLAVNGTLYQNPSGTFDLTGNILTSSPATLSGLSVSSQYFFDPSSPTVRVVYSFNNPGASPITAAVTVGHNLGSDSSTIIVTTSSGDNLLTAADRWVITSDGAVAHDPVLSFVRYGPGATAPTATHVPGTLGDKYADQYTITVAPGATQRVMVFGRLSQDSASALAAMNTFSSNASLASAGLLNGLTAQQEAEIVNWGNLSSAGSSVQSVPALGTSALLVLAVLLGALATRLLRRRPAV